MNKRFTMVFSALWHSRFAKLSNEAKLLFFYFLTCQHQTSIGAYAIPDGYVLTDIGWDAETFERVREELLEAAMIAWDEVAQMVFIERWFKHVTLGPKNEVGCQRLIDDLDAGEFREHIRAEFEAVRRKRRSRLEP